MTEWEDYEAAFRLAVARADYRHKFDDAYVERCLAYAKPLVDQRLPVIFDQYHLARLVGYATDYLYGVSNAPDRFYRTYSIPKRSGGLRRIAEPLPSLKEIQRWILDNILGRVPAHPFAKGFVEGRSIRDNARFHQRQEYVLTVDIENFFDRIPDAKIRRIFIELNYTPRVAILLASLCTLSGFLPQGAPTSPALSNLASIEIDKRLAGFARKLRIRYTRYADDLTFSGKFDAGDVITFVDEVLHEHGLNLNRAKTRLMRPHQRQETTGVVVNRKLQVPRQARREIRKICWYVEKFGLESHLLKVRDTRAGYLRHILGLVGHVLFINPADKDALKARRLLEPLLHPDSGQTVTTPRKAPRTADSRGEPRA